MGDDPAAGGSPPESQPKPAQRKRKQGAHVTMACNGCRRRRAKCDGQPSCKTCTQYGELCVYSDQPDGRKPTPRAYVEALEQRIKMLEAVLDARGISQDGGSGSKGKRRATAVGKEEGTGSDDNDTAGWSASDVEAHDATESLPVERLKIDDDTGELRAYGPTSAFVHLPEPQPPSASSSPVASAPSPQSLPSVSHSLFGGAGRDRSGSNVAASTSPSQPFLREEDLVEDYEPADWKLNLPNIPELDEELHNHLLDLFFSYFCVWCCWTDPDLFRRDMRLCDGSSPARPSRTSYYSSLLHNAVLSLATAYSDDPRLEGAGVAFADKAKEAMEEEAERPMLSTVQGLMLLGSYYSGRARHGLGWLWAGMGLRMSTTLGLGIDSSVAVSKGLISPLLRDQRDRTFYCLYVQDKLWSLYVGRSASLSKHSSETPLPRVDSIRDGKAWKPVPPLTSSSNSTTGSSSQPGASPINWLDFEKQSQKLREEGVPNRISLNFQWTCRLSILAERMMEAVYSLKANIYSAPVLERVSNLHLQLEKWMTDLPQELQISSHASRPPPPHVIMLNAYFNFLILLLHRPYYTAHNAKHSEANEVAAKRCDKAASRIVQLNEIFHQSPGLRYAPISLTQMTFSAGSIHLLAAVSPETPNKAPKKAAVSLAQAEACVRALEEMGKSWAHARQSGEILDRLIKEWSPPVPKPETIPPPRSVVAQQALDPHSELAKQLLELGWTPPTTIAPATALEPITAQELPPSINPPLAPTSHSEEYSPFYSSQPHQNLFIPTPTPNRAAITSPLNGLSGFGGSNPLPLDFLQQASVPSGNPFSDEGVKSFFEGAYTGGWPGGVPQFAGGGAWTGPWTGDESWLNELNMDM
ncbi:hypothetical protein T439DRAFT_383241 [Meredithblackwellia eburnea MCA 4105]